MKFRSAAARSAVIIAILLLSTLIGYLYHTFGHEVDLKNHPREYAEFVTKYCAEYGVPEYIVYGIILTESDFQSNHVSDDGEVGLMQLSPEIFEKLTSLTKENLEAGILYDPETNIRYGVYLLSHWFTQYNRWNTVTAMYLTDEATVTSWMNNPDNVDENGNLTVIPDEEIEARSAALWEEIEMYRKLYYNN